MLTILNRRELLVTLSMERQAEVRRILAENGIDYTIKTTNMQGGMQKANMWMQDLTRALHGSIKFMCIRRIWNMHCI